VGISISWLTVQGAGRGVVLDALGLEETDKRDEYPTQSPIAGATLADGWYVIVLDRYGHALLGDDTLHRLSKLGHVVAGAGEEHVMCSLACGWQQGQRVWSVMHDAQVGIEHLEVEGQTPSGFEQIRDHALSQQEAEGGSEADINYVDYVYDIPLATAKLVTGFSWDETQPEDGLVVLRRNA
jgi:hypothetical protein